MMQDEQVKFVAEHVRVAGEEGVKIPEEGLKEMHAYVEKHNQSKGSQKSQETPISEANTRAASGGRCCSFNFWNLDFYECVDSSGCHESKHTVIVDLPCVTYED